ncbi:MAG: tRNA lysidine(34) synthetase TilS [Sphingomonadales bacterium]
MTKNNVLLTEFEAGLEKALSTLGMKPEILSHSRLAVAVSGGADSMALVHLLHDLLGPEKLMGLSVDHGLRREARDEVMQVANWLSELKISYHIFAWEGEKPESGIQEAARQARYELMENWCVENNVDFLCLGHHRRDQAETFLLRLARGSGIWGLSAMSHARPALTRDGKPYLLRPLLDIDARDLRIYLKQKGQKWIEDPSNADLQYDRVKIRQFLAQPPLEGLNEKRLSETAARMSRARDALNHYMETALQRSVAWSSWGSAEIDWKFLLPEPDEVVLRALSQILMRIGGRAMQPRLRHLENWLTQLRENGPDERTLAGCQIVHVAEGKSLVCRETQNVRDGIEIKTATTELVWDGRFKLNIQDAPEGARIEKLGHIGWAQMKEADFVSDCPYIIAATQPALWCGQILCAAPTLGYACESLKAKIDAHFIA